MVDSSNNQVYADRYLAIALPARPASSSYHGLDFVPSLLLRSTRPEGLGRAPCTLRGVLGARVLFRQRLRISLRAARARRQG